MGLKNLFFFGLKIEKEIKKYGELKKP